ncbi:MAG: phosphoribosylformylglycinamidine synthase subunit PurL [Candidatus Omnitrophica bacterium]|nr:phosphoribosylformylglycinamidine synthase subunit PurL [Candidatus Omnitrophota bacterium]
MYGSLAAGILKTCHELGLTAVKNVDVHPVYLVQGDVSDDQIDLICQELLVDNITQEYTFCELSDYAEPKKKKDSKYIEIAYNPGVMDPVEESTMKGIRDLGISSVLSVRTARAYYIDGRISAESQNILVSKVLANKLIQHIVKTEDRRKSLLLDHPDPECQVVTVPLIKASDRQLKHISQKGQLFLNLEEMKTIQRHFKKLKRDPTDCEMETIAQTWSEHCYHKTFRGTIRYQYEDKGRKKTKIIRNLLKSTIKKATEDINKPWCVSVFHDNAGVIEFDSDSHICFKVETHNHPSALEPYGGANTGIGGVIRDILGTGLGAKPICCTDVFCFSPPDVPFDSLPAGTLHPKRVMQGVVSGVRDYGNKMGIPTVNGAVLFDPLFVGNPLVYCGNVGIMPKDKVEKRVCKGDLVVVVGGRTGRDGIHGATFSSGELTTESEVVSSGAVQIGDPIQEKKVLDALLVARDRNLYTSITDCGAGGLSSAAGEMGIELGVRIELDQVPLKYHGLGYEEIWISESQERMVLSVPKTKVKKLLKVFRDENVEAEVIGEFTGDAKLEIFYHGLQVCDLDMSFLHEGTPKITKEAVWKPAKHKEPRLPKSPLLNEALLNVLGHYNVCSKEWIVRQYDHEVQGGSVIKPFCGVDADGPSDASVIAPKFNSRKGIAIANGVNANFGKIDPYWMAASCIDESIRQIVAVGGDVERIAILDNFCWGNPDKPDRLGGLVRCAQGCYRTAVGYQVPFISGKDSLYNEYAEGKKSIAIPGTILISAIGIIEDVDKTVTMDFKEAGNLIYCVGETSNELGGSIYYDTLGKIGRNVPQVREKKGMKIFKSVHSIVQKGYARSIHDCSEGGLGVCLAEMAFSGGLGATVRLDQVAVKGAMIRDDVILFSESNSRFVIEVQPRHQQKFEAMMKGTACARIGAVEATPEFLIYGIKQNVVVNTYIQDLKQVWQEPLQW